MDCALSVSQVLTGTRPNMMTISARSFSTKPHVFFRNNLSPSTSKFSYNVFCGISKLLRSSQTLVSPLVLAQRFFSDQAGKGDGGGKTTRIIISSEPAPFEASFALACVLGIFCFASMLMLSPTKAMANNASSNAGVSSETTQESGSRISPISGRFVLTEFIEGVLLLRSQPKTMRELKEQALIKLKSGMSHDEVVKQMKLAAEKIDRGRAGEYDFRMAVVELLILQGKFNEAASELKIIPVGEKAGPSDQTRHSFYRAIIQTGLGERETAKEAWQQFIDEGFHEAFPTPNADNSSVRDIFIN